MSGRSSPAGILQPAALLLAAWVWTGCDQVCVGKTPIEQIACSDSGSGTLTGPGGSPTSSVRIIGGGVPLLGGSNFAFMVAADNLGATFSGPFSRGPGTYPLPSSEITFSGAVELPGATTAVSLQLVSGSIVAQITDPSRLMATLDAVFATDTGVQFVLSGATVDVSCQYDDTVCR
jgi:hypothetical protein